ncbi:MAG: DUF1778 domain-containing protein [Microcystaceae cyanobacterium]
MASKTNPRPVEWVEARVSPEIKELLRQASTLEGRILTDFIFTTVQKEAIRVIEQHRTLKLNIEDSEALVDALLNPPMKLYFPLKSVQTL